MEKNLDITNPPFNEQIWPVPSDFVKSRFHCIKNNYFHLIKNLIIRSVIQYICMLLKNAGSLNSVRSINDVKVVRIFNL